MGGSLSSLIGGETAEDNGAEAQDNSGALQQPARQEPISRVNIPRNLLVLHRTPNLMRADQLFVMVVPMATVLQAGRFNGQAQLQIVQLTALWY